MKKTKNKGMAMLEVLIAMVVVGIGVLPLVFLQVQADRGMVSAYNKVEHNSAALSIMEMVAADANKNAWVMSLVSGECSDAAKCGGVEWRKKVADELLRDVLPNPGSGLLCIAQQPVKSGAVDTSIEMELTLWWYSSGRGKSEPQKMSKTGAFVAGDCNNEDLATKLNIDTVSITRIF